MVRPLCLEWPDLDAVYAIRDQFLLGDSLMVSVYRKDGRLFLPKGRWCDFWTGRVYEGADGYVDVPVPEGRGGHLLLREGAFVPTMPVAQYVTPGKLEEVKWMAFPGAKPSHFDLYMDDGATRAHADGEFALQRVTLRDGALEFGTISGARGDFLKSVRHTVLILGGK